MKALSIKDFKNYAKDKFFTRCRKHFLRMKSLLIEEKFPSQFRLHPFMFNEESSKSLQISIMNDIHNSSS
jgi:hypothetical protein